MKLISTTQLTHQAQNKVYHIDLCKVGADLYVVNIRYGQLGATLKEGVKTDLPVSKTHAERLIKQTINIKRQNGYRSGTEGKPTYIHPDSDDIQDARKEGVMKALNGILAGEKVNWAPSRVIWRAGELRLQEATLLIAALSTDDAMTQYCMAWALGRIGDKKGVATLRRIETDGKTAHAKRMATEALSALLEGEAKEEFTKGLVANLPKGVKGAVQKKDWDKLSLNVNERVYSKKKKELDFINPLYILSKDEPAIRVILLKLVKSLPIKPGYFKILRQLFKTGEFRQDGEFFGLIAYRFEKATQVFKKPKYSGGVWVSGQGWVRNYKDQLKNDSGTIAFSDKTKAYFSRRVWWTLRRTAELGDENYIKMATGVLLPYNDENDIKRTYSTISWTFNQKTRRYYKGTNRYDSHAEYLALNHILYGSSARYELKPSGKAWSCKGDYIPGQPAPDHREEAYPTLWDNMPNALVHLLVKSNAERIHNFAVKALQDNKAFEAIKAKFDTSLIIQFLQKPFQITNALALNIAKTKYDAKQPDMTLVAAMVNSQSDEARATAEGWIKDRQDVFYADSQFVKDLITSVHANVRAWMRKDLQAITLGWSADKKTVLIGRVVAHLLSLSKSDVNNNLVKEIGETLLLTFPNELKEIGLKVIRDLLRHHLSENQALAGRILLAHNTPVNKMPNDLLEALLNSDSANVRQVGIQLFGQYTDDVLFAKQETLFDFITSPLEDVRQAIRPIIARLIPLSKEFSAELVNVMIPFLWRKERYNGLHADLYKMLTTELEESLNNVERKNIFRLLNAKYESGQELGITLLQKFIPAETLTVRQIIRIADHEILAARKTAWNMYNDNLARMRYEREEAIRLLDAKWDDSRAFAFDYFRKHFKDQDWTPQLLVAVCDSVREDVQALGRELITKFFKEENGTEYLVKLSQHPKSELQTLATNYLTRFASDNLDRLKSLELFFVTVLSRVNKGRVAKTRVLHFLKTEGMKSMQAAKFVTEILNRISLTMSIGDKASCIEILRDIQTVYPHVKSNVAIQEVAVKA